MRSGSPPAGYETGYIACSEAYGAIDGGITLANVAEDAFVTCQWYFVTTGADPVPEPTNPPATDPEPTNPPVSGLPTTGSGPVKALSDHPWLPAIFGVIAILILHTGHTLWQRRRKARRHLAERR